MTATLPTASSVRRRLAGVPAAVPPLAVAGVAVLGCLYVGLTDPIRSQVLWPCPFKAVTGGLDCPGCGATRAVHSLLHVDVGAALGFNALAVVALPYILYSWLAWALPTATTIRLPVLRLPARAIYGVLVAVILWWVVRNLPFAPFAALHSDR